MTMVRRWGAIQAVVATLGAGALATTAWAASNTGDRAAGAPTCDGRTPTIVGTDDPAAPDDIVGTDGDDVIAALGGDDTVDGGAGNDVICGGAGTDVLAGGAGDDRVFGQLDGLRPVVDNPPDVVGDTVSGGPGDDLLDPGDDQVTDGGGGFQPDTITFRDSATGVSVDLAAGTATGEGVDTLVVPPGRTWLVGSEHPDVLEGTGRDDMIDGLGGADVLRGLGGADSLSDEIGDPTPSRAWDDRLFGGPGRDYLRAGFGADHVVGGGGRDQIEDVYGAADIVAGPGDDDVSATFDIGVPAQSVSGGPGRDAVRFNAGPTPGESRFVDAGLVRLARGRVVFRVDSTQTRADLVGVEGVGLPRGRWTFYGTAADETVIAFTTRDSPLVAYLGAGRDLALGSEGADQLTGGPGRDTVDAGQGRDLCRGFESVSRCEVTR